MKPTTIHLLIAALLLLAVPAAAQDEEAPEDPPEWQPVVDDPEDDLEELPSLFERTEQGLKLLAAEASPLPLQARAETSVVHVRTGAVGGGSSSGVLVAPDTVVASAAAVANGQLIRVESKTGESRGGRVVDTDLSLGLVRIQLDAPFENADPIPLVDGAANAASAVGWDVPPGIGDAGTLRYVDVQGEPVTEAYLRLDRVLPASFEGAAVIDPMGELVGIVVGPSLPGAPVARSTAAVREFVEREPQQIPEPPDTDTKEVPVPALAWSLGLGVSLALPHKTPNMVAWSGRLDLIIKHRILIGGEAFWGGRWTDRPSSDPAESTLVPARYQKAYVGGVFEPVLGRLRNVGFGINLGGGALYTRRMIPQIFLQFPPTCDPNSGPCQATPQVGPSQPEAVWDPTVSAGIEMLRLNDGPIGTMVGLRLGYRFYISFADFNDDPNKIMPGRSTHSIYVMVQI